MRKKIVMICVEGKSSNYLYNHVIKEFEIESVFLITKNNNASIIKKRFKKLGALKVFGQLLFIFYTRLFLKRMAKTRIKELEKIYNLNDSKIPKDIIYNFNSVNSKELKTNLISINPDIVIINGTEIIKKDILESVEAYFLNIHTGITPKYRGVHGGYWSLRNQDNLAGVTTHLVDTGIDTGKVLNQELIEIEKSDNFLTYPILQLAKAFENYNDIIWDLLNDRQNVKEPLTKESKLWSHPTIFEYFIGKIIKKVK